MGNNIRFQPYTGEAVGTPVGVMLRIERALWKIKQERIRQEEKWNTQRHDFSIWLVVLMEEVGEFSKELLDFRVWMHKIEMGYADPMRLTEDDQALSRAVQSIDKRETLAVMKRMRDEAVQIAALGTAIVEHLDELIDEFDPPRDRVTGIGGGPIAPTDRIEDYVMTDDAGKDAA